MAREVTARVFHLAWSAAALGGHVETQSTDIEVFLNGVLPCLSWSSPLSPPMWCPSESCSGDGVGGHAEDMS